MKKKIIYPVVIVFFLLITTGLLRVHSEFLLDEEESRGQDIVIIEKKEPARPSYIALNIRTERVPLAEDTVQITWDVNPAYSGDFVVGRSSEIIDTQEKALAAKTINTVSTRDRSLVIDSGLAPGTYYYVILAREKVVERNIELVRDMNFSTKGVTIVAREAGGPPRQVTGIRIQRAGKKGVLLTWKKIPSEGITYTIYRSNEPVSTIDRLRNAVIRVMVTDIDNYIDENIDTNDPCYYAVTARDSAGRENTELIAESNYTGTPFYFGLEIEKVERVTYRPVKLKGVNENGTIKLKWEHTGNAGVRFFRIFRTRELPLVLEEVRDDWVIADVDILSDGFSDPDPLDGSLYYGIVPYLTGENGTLKLEKGVYVTGESLLVHKAPVRNSVDEYENRTIEPGKDDPVPLKKAPVEGDRLKRILRRSFFNGHYALAIKELQQFIVDTDNENEKAQARLFIARSLIELKEYRKALGILARPDVMEYYPDESRFWSDYAIRQDR